MAFIQGVDGKRRCLYRLPAERLVQERPTEPKEMTPVNL